MEQIKADLFSDDAAKRELLRSFTGSICAMTRAESLDIAESGAVPDDAGHALVSGVEVVVPLKELIDVDAELDKLARERKALEQDLQRSGCAASWAMRIFSAMPRLMWLRRSRPSWRS